MKRASIWISISHNLHHMDQQNIYLPCSCKGLMKIKSSFNWYCSLNELGWQNGRGESRRVPSMNCVRNELMNVILVWLPWLLNYTKSYCTTRTHVYIHMCVHVHVLHQLLFLFLYMYISFVPLLFNIPIITSSGWNNVTLCRRITIPSNILMSILFFETQFGLIVLHYISSIFKPRKIW